MTTDEPTLYKAQTGSPQNTLGMVSNHSTRVGVEVDATAHQAARGLQSGSHNQVFAARAALLDPINREAKTGGDKNRDSVVSEPDRTALHHRLTNPTWPDVVITC